MGCCFCGEGRAGGDLQTVVRRSLLFPAREPHPGLENPRGAAELRLGEPKSAHGEGGNLAVPAVRE